jgi:hypothetical protein
MQLLLKGEKWGTFWLKLANTFLVYLSSKRFLQFLRQSYHFLCFDVVSDAENTLKSPVFTINP